MKMLFSIMSNIQTHYHFKPHHILFVQLEEYEMVPDISGSWWIKYANICSQSGVMMPIKIVWGNQIPAIEPTVSHGMVC